MSNQILHQWLEEKDKEAGIYLDDVKIENLSNLSKYVGKALIVCGAEEWLALDNTKKWKVRLCTVIKGKDT